MEFDDPMMNDGFGYFGHENEEAAWSDFMTKFATMERGQRVQYIKNVDSYLSSSKITKEAASIWQKKRDLIALNDRLLRAGK
jgi:hypothetical protein